MSERNMNSAPPKKLPDRFLGLFLEILPGEGAKALVMFFYFFLVILAYYLIKPATRALMMETFGAGNLPLGNFSTALIIGFAVVGFDFLAARFKRQNLVAITTGIGILLLLAIWGGLSLFSDPWARKACALAFFVFADVYSVMGTTLFWSFSHDLFTSTEGKRLYGFIGAGGAMGGALGGLIAGWISPLIGTRNLSLVAIMPLFATIILAYYIIRLGTSSESDGNQKSGNTKGGSGIEGLRLIVGNRYLQLITAMISLTLMASLVIETQFNLAIEEAIPKTDERASFMGFRDTQLTLIQFFSQALLTGPLIRTLGIRGVLLVMPIGDTLMGLLFFLLPGLGTANWAKIFDGSLKYGTNQVTKEMLYLPTAPAVKYQAKAFIDVFFHRIAKGVSAALILYFTQVLRFTKTDLFFPLAVFGVLWILVVIAMYRLYGRQIEERVCELYQGESELENPSELPPTGDGLKELFLAPEFDAARALRSLSLLAATREPEPNRLNALFRAWDSNSKEGRSLVHEWLKFHLPGNYQPLLVCFSSSPPGFEDRRKLVQTNFP